MWFYLAQLGNLLVTGSSRLLGKLFCEDINISDSLVVKTLNANDITATSVTTSGLTVNGNATTTGTLNVGNSATNGKLSLNNKIAIRDNGYSWLGINDQIAFGSGVYFGKSTVAEFYSTHLLQNSQFQSQLTTLSPLIILQQQM